MKTFLKGIAGVLLLTMAFLGLSIPFAYADVPGSLASDRADQETLLVAQMSDAHTLDPHAGNDRISSRVIAQIYETLVVQNEQMEIEPGLAESWSHINDLTLEFKLKKGVKFHNGEAFTAEDVKFTLLRAMESPNISHIVNVIAPSGIQVIDDYTIQITTTEPYPAILAQLTHVNIGILNEKAVTEAGDDYGQNPVGTGPFKLDKWNIGNSIELHSFKDYHGKAPGVDKIIFRNIPMESDRLMALINGEIDIAYDVLAANLDIFKLANKMTLYRTPNQTSSYIGFNTQKEPYADKKVRQAINYAIDMESITAIVNNGAFQRASGPLSPGVWAFNENISPYEYDVEKAKKLLADAGYPDGFKTSIFINDNPQRIQIANLIAEQLQSVNIDVEVKILDWGEYLDRTANGEHDMFVLGWTTVNGDPDYGLYPLFHSSQFGDFGNRTYYSNNKVDELLEKGRVEADSEKRKIYYLEVQKLLHDEAPWIFTWIHENVDITRSNVKGFKQHPSGNHLLSGVHLE